MTSNLFFTSQSWKDFPVILKQELEVLPNNAVVIEIGGGANPTLSQEEVERHKIEYIIIDIDQEELDKAEGRYFKKMCLDVTKDKFEAGQADLIITHMLLEHVKNPREFHTACLSLLKPKGRAVHFFATLYSMASIANLILPEFISKRILYAVQKRKWDTEGKFPAYYRWSKGPIKGQITRFKKLGFGIELYNGYLGQNYFYNKPPLSYIEKGLNWFLMKVKSPQLCSNAILVLSKP